MQFPDEYADRSTEPRRGGSKRAGGSASRSRSKSRSQTRSIHEPSTLKKKRIVPKAERTGDSPGAAEDSYGEEGEEEGEEEDQEEGGPYARGRGQMEGRGIGADMDYGEEGEEGDEGEDSEEYEDESLQKSNAHPYPRGGDGLEQRLE